MTTANYEQILHFIKKEGFTFEIKGYKAKTEDTFGLASVKNQINGGIYFAESKAIIEKVNCDYAIILVKEFPIDEKYAYIKVENPQLVHYTLSHLFIEEKKHRIHPTAIISSNAVIGTNVHIGPYSILENCKIGDNVRIEAHVVIKDNCEIGNNSVIDCNSVIGADGIAWAWKNEKERVIQKQLGGVVIGSECHIGTDVTIVRGSVSEFTSIGDKVLISHGTKIGHGCTIKELVHLANNVSLAGNAHVSEKSYLGSAAVVSSNVSIGRNCIVGAGAVVTETFEENNLILVGVPAKPKILDKDKFKGVPKK